MQSTTRETVLGVFADSDQARDAIEALKDAGYSAADISVLMPDRSDTKAMAEETGTQAGATATGAVAGGLLGGAAGWLVGIGALAIPGAGPFIAAGALATALTGAALGAGAGAVAGALVDAGVPEEHARWYEGEVHSGRTLVTVRADGRYAEAQSLLRRYGAYDVETGSGRGTESSSGEIPTTRVTREPSSGTYRPSEGRADASL